MDWSTRIWCESRLHDQNSFITLTYATPLDTAEQAVESFKRFNKRIRHYPIMRPWRYFSTIERGSLNGRLHHHMIIFGHDFLEPAKKRILVKEWPNGFVDIAPCNSATINYVAGYTAKKLNDEMADDIRVKASINPAIGYDWLRLNISDVQNLGGIVIEGKLRPIPDLFLNRAKEPLKHVIQDHRNYAASTHRSDDAIKAREELLKHRRREAIQRKKL